METWPTPFRWLAYTLGWVVGVALAIGALILIVAFIFVGVRWGVVNLNK